MALISVLIAWAVIGISILIQMYYADKEGLEWLLAKQAGKIAELIIFYVVFVIWFWIMFVPGTLVFVVSVIGYGVMYGIVASYALMVGFMVLEYLTIAFKGDNYEY